MLRELHISNFALIDNLTLPFGEKLTVLTGETGAGKSIIIEALGLVLGERADISDIRAGKSTASVEAVFDIGRNGKLKNVLNDLGIEREHEQLILRRSMNQASGSRNFINDKPVTLKVMKQIGDELVDIHGQHEHQHLLRTDTHIDYLDNFLKLGELQEEVRSKYRSYKHKVALRKKRKQQLKELKEKEELLRFQVKEIDDAQLESDEDETLEARQRILENAERLMEIVDASYTALYDQEDSISELLQSIQSQIGSLIGIDERLRKTKEALDTIVFQVEEVAQSLSSYGSKMEYDPDELAGIEKRLDLINRLKMKYGRSIPEILAYQEQSQRAVKELEDIEIETDALDKEIETASQELRETAYALSEQRGDGKATLEKAVNRELAELGMASSSFTVSHERNEDEEGMEFPDGKRYRVTERGIDRITFLITTNPGEPSMELRKIVSGGELSRIMLALKSILAKLDNIFCMVFDEPDAGIGGAVAEEVGNKMKKVSKERQVITITHLHQIASKADAHIKVEKKKKGKRMITLATVLEKEERIQEIARLISGERISKTALEHARAIITTERGKQA
jgi:DNA repair protein RecN (Recombination protein N)